MEVIKRKTDIGTFEFTMKTEIVVGGELEWNVRFIPSKEFLPGSHLRITVPAYQHQRSEEYLQAYDYWMPNYICAQSLNESTPVDIHVEKIETKFTHINIWHDSCRVGVVTFEKGLKVGDEINIRFGGIDRPWLEGDCAPSRVGQLAFSKHGSYLHYKLEVDCLGTNEYRLHNIFPSIKLLPEALAKLQIYAPSVVSPDEDTEVTILPTDRFGNPIFDEGLNNFELLVIDEKTNSTLKSVIIDNQKARISVPEGLYRLTVVNGGYHVDDAVVMCKQGAQRLYWGDTHVHSNLTANIRDNDFNATPAACYTYAKSVANLDFVCLTEQTFTFNEDRTVNIDKATWNKMGVQCDKYNEPHTFVTMTGFELHGKRGDTVCIFKDSLQNVDYPTSEFSIIHNVWDFYKDVEMMTIPHLHRFCNGRTPKYFDNQDKKFEAGFDLANWERSSDKETMVEVYSAQWGRFEYEGNPMLLKARNNVKNNTVVDFLNRGKKWGLVANSDGHDGNPGYGGVTGVYTNELTRESIFDAIKGRQTICTTHPRMVMEFSADGKSIGSTVTVDETVELKVLILAPRPLMRVDIIKNGEVLSSYTGNKRFVELELSDTPECGDNYYYVRAYQDDGHIGWISPIWVKM